MKSGPQLDALVAEKVMGLCSHIWEYAPRPEPEPCPTCGEYGEREDRPKYCRRCGHTGKWNRHCTVGGGLDCKEYSTSIEAAAEIEAKIGEGYDPEGPSDHAPNVRVWKYLEELHKLVGHPISYDASFDDDWALIRATPQQRCLAALKAVSAEVPA